MLHSRGDPGTYSLSLVVTPSLWAPRQPAQGPGFSCPQCVGFCSSGSAFISPGNLDFPADSCPAGCILQVGPSLKANRSRGVTWGVGSPGQASHCVMSLGELDPSMSVLWIVSVGPRNKNAPKEDNPSPPRAQRQSSGIKSDRQGASCCLVHFLSPSQHRHHTATTIFDPSCHSAPASSFSHVEHVPGDQCAGAPCEAWNPDPGPSSARCRFRPCPPAPGALRCLPWRHAPCTRPSHLSNHATRVTFSKQCMRSREPPVQSLLMLPSHRHSNLNPLPARPPDQQRDRE